MERLEYLIVIAEEKNLTRAAEKLYISQPALTKYIQKLEQEYGVKLLERSHHSVDLTEAGQIFLREKLKMVTIERNLRQELNAIQSKRQTITVGSGHSRGNSALPGAVEAFCSRHPEVDISVITRGELELLKRLSRGEYDLVFGVLGPSDGQFEMTYISTERVGIVMPRSFGVVPDSVDPRQTLREPYLLSPDQLNGLNLIQSDSSIGSYLSYNALLSQYNIRHAQVITTNNPNLISGLVKRGVGYGIGTFRADGGNYLDEKGELAVYRCTLPGLAMQRTVSAAFLKDSPKTALLQELVALLQEEAGKA